MLELPRLNHAISTRPRTIILRMLRQISQLLSHLVLENTIHCKTPRHFLLDKIVCEYLYEL